MYGGTNRAARVMFSDLGISFSFVDFRDPEVVKAAIRPNTKLIFSETPANPVLTLTDIKVLYNLGILFLEEKRSTVFTTVR